MRYAYQKGTPSNPGGQQLKTKAYIGIISVLATAIVSGIILWKTVIEQVSLGQFGLGGVFLASMLSHMTIVGRDLFVPVFLPLSAIYHPILVGTITGWGGAIGDVTAYFLGWGVAETMGANAQRNDRLTRWIKRYGIWSVLLFSATPLPDTPIVMLAGSSHLPFKKILLAQGVGKMLLYSLGAIVGGFVFAGLSESLGSIYASVIVVVISVGFCFLVNWSRSRELILGWLERLIP